MTEVHLL